MTAELSIVIPTLDAADRIGPCLAALAEPLGEGLIRELILADGGSSDDIGAVADAVGAELVRAPRGRGTQLAAGAAAARGGWLLFLHADTVPEPGWAHAVRAHMRDHPDNAGWFRLRFDATGLSPRIVARWANLRARHLGLPYGDQGLLIRRDLYMRVGGHPPVPLMEDVALARALRGRLRVLDSVAVTSAARYEAEGWLLRGLRNWSLLMRYLMGAKPDSLVSRYEGGRHG